MTDYQPQSRAYQTSLDRAGWALATGGAFGGIVTTGLVVAGGTGDPVRIGVAFLLGTLMSALAITAVATPLWAVMHAFGWRRAVHAAMTGAACGFVLFLFGQTYGFGVLDAPPSDVGTLLFRWASAAATSAIIALVAALIGLVMWRVAYRSPR